MYINATLSTIPRGGGPVNHTIKTGKNNGEGQQRHSTWTRLAIPMARTRLVSQQALTMMTMNKTFHPPPAFTPRVFSDPAPLSPSINFEHYANSMVHPIVRKTISSYLKLMNNPVTAEVWQTAFGKDFGGMVQGDNKMG
jgi:hypothetical protein